MRNDYISRALQALKKEINDSELTSKSRNNLDRLIELLLDFYYIRLDAIVNSMNSIERKKHQVAILSSNMVDYIVSINDTLKGKNEPSGIVGLICREINYDDKKRKFKFRRLK